jgi:hypothetical protein
MSGRSNERAGPAALRKIAASSAAPSDAAEPTMVPDFARSATAQLILQTMGLI